MVLTGINTFPFMYFSVPLAAKVPWNPMYQAPVQTPGKTSGIIRSKKRIWDCKVRHVLLLSAL